MIAALVAALAVGSGSPAVVTQDPPIRLWINEDRHFERGDRAKVQVETDQDGYVVVLHADPDGRVRVLFPVDPGDDNFLRGGHRYEIQGRGGRESFAIEVSSGQGTVYAAVAPDPFHFDQFVQGDHWDFRALNATELSRDPEPDLTDLVRRMAGGRFDYDLLNYDVSYGPSYSSTAYYAASPVVVRPSYYDPFCDFSWDCDPYYFSGRSGLSVNLIFGRPYRYHYYDPFGYNPYYYEPFYYGYGSYGYRRSGYGYNGYYPGYYPRSVYQGQIRTPYQFKSINRTWSGTGGISRFGRDNNIGQATHTVYGPGRNQPAIGTPNRPDLDGKPRVTPVTDPVRNSAADARRRRVEDSRRNDSGRDDARRAEPRQSDPMPREVKPDNRDRGVQDRGTENRGVQDRGTDNRGNEGRRSDPVRDGQRGRQAERSRRFDAMPEARRVEPRQYQPENRQYQPPQREQPRQYQPPARESEPRQREYQPPREQPRAEPRSAPPPREDGGYARPSQANQGRFHK